MLDPGGSQSLLSAGVLGCCVVLGCLVNLGGVCVAVLLRSGDVLGCGAAWGVLLGSGGVLAEACGVLHVFGGVVVGGWWCSVELVPGQSGRAMNLGRAL